MSYTHEQASRMGVLMSVPRQCLNCRILGTVVVNSQEYYADNAVGT